MELLQDGVIAALAAIGLAAVLWLLAGLVLGREAPVQASYLVPVRGDAPALELTLRRLSESRRLPVILVDCGLTEVGRRRLQLSAPDTALLVTPAELAGLFEGQSETEKKT